MTLAAILAELEAEPAPPSEDPAALAAHLDRRRAAVERLAALGLAHATDSERERAAAIWRSGEALGRRLEAMRESTRAQARELWRSQFHLRTLTPPSDDAGVWLDTEG